MDLMRQIQRCGGLVKYDDSRLLADGPGNEDPLTFPDAQLIQFAVCEIFHIGSGHGPLLFS
jgi:hypothetical protein